MTLAVVLGMYALLAAPPASAYSPPGLTSQSQQDAPQSSPPQSPPEGSQPNSQPEPTSPAPPQAKPDQPATPQRAPAPDGAAPEPAQPAATAAKPEAKPTPAKKSKKHSKKTKPTAQASDVPAKTVVRNGSTADPEGQLSPGLSQEQSSRQRQNTTHLLERTEANLRKASVRELSASQQDMVRQIRTYVDQAKAAAESGDLQRAHNLAFKAHLLSDELLQR